MIILKTSVKKLELRMVQLLYKISQNVRKLYEEYEQKPINEIYTKLALIKIMFGLLRPWSPRASSPRDLASSHDIFIFHILHIFIIFCPNLDLNLFEPFKTSRFRFPKVNGMALTNLPHGVLRPLFKFWKIEFLPKKVKKNHVFPA